MSEISPDDPLWHAIPRLMQELEDKWHWLRGPYWRLDVERRQAYHAQKPKSVKPVRDYARSRIDLDHPLNPQGERSVKEDWDYKKAKETFYGPGGAMNPDDKKIISIPGVETTNRASSLM